MLIKLLFFLKMHLMKMIFKKTGNLKYHQSYVVQKINLKRLNNEKICVGFFILYPKTFPAISLLEEFKNSEKFEILGILIPDTFRHKSSQLDILKKNKESFNKIFKNLIIPFNEYTKEFIDISEKLDFICFSNPYDCLTHKFFTINYIKNKDVLPFYMNYGFNITNYSKNTIGQKEFSYFWKIFVETEECKKYYVSYSPAKEDSLSVVGYAKMDTLASHGARNRSRKKIILAPHHTVKNLQFELQMSNFIRYADFFLTLPNIFSSIDFVFRPHPLLFYNLEEAGIWDSNKINLFLQKLQSFENMEFDEKDSYMDLFANSDGLIHDCGSFTGEYLFTGKPACFLLGEQGKHEEFTPLGENCLGYHYLAKSEEEIIAFIDRIIIQGDDYKKEDRDYYASNKLKINYPNVGKRIFDVLNSTT
jgi:hypothetical protein